MREIDLPDKLKKNIALFSDRLKDAYAEELISVILYGSAASGEFVDKRSNINFLVVLKSAEVALLKKASALTRKFPLFQPLFLSEDYIARSTDIFPIEFLDMRENYTVVYGKDVLSAMHIDLKNLRFQCEHELKAKLIALRQLYLRLSGQPTLLLQTMLKAFTAVLHISRNVLRLKGLNPAYKKELIVEELASAFPINPGTWQKILAVKNNMKKLGKSEIEELFLRFVNELQKMVEVVDKL